MGLHTRSLCGPAAVDSHSMPSRHTVCLVHSRSEVRDLALVSHSSSMQVVCSAQPMCPALPCGDAMSAPAPLVQPLQATQLAWPSFGWKKPSAQLVQPVEPASAKRPVLHVSHAMLPSS